MNMYTYAAEKLMQLRQTEVERASRTAWMWNDKNKSNQSAIGKLLASWINKKAELADAVSEACCSCCAVNP
ncbi:hypothetical protein [Paenibacillus montanisoli]|uniref:Uncharacterized protein n=1 Tax=Paenibacillus montanisoli TaxID=2081970 RepID=A0A328U4G1_9BACL|nr:hypothetical protein [Paenibacillus montanisoli]RAP77698.1 hypothetical protein DL346_04320 [Paenibacillus montanisoli]